MKKRENRPVFNTVSFVIAVVCLVAFLAIGLTGYYLTEGEFVSAQLAAVYALLAVVGAVAVFFRLYPFAVLYYVGCAAGWGLGWYIGGLKGDFAPVAGTICTVFFIVIFTIFGALAQRKGLRKLMEQRRADAAQEEEDRKSEELDRVRLERENAEALMNDAFGVEDGVDVTTPAAALDQAARLAFAEEPPAQLEIPADRLDPGQNTSPLFNAGQPAAVPDQPVENQLFTASRPATVLDQPLPDGVQLTTPQPVGNHEAAAGPMSRPGPVMPEPLDVDEPVPAQPFGENKKSAATPTGAAADGQDQL